MALEQIWTVTGILLGFQFTMIVWRINREISIEDKAHYLYHQTTEENLKQEILRDRLWLPLCDWMNIASIIVLLIWVFIVPVYKHGFDHLDGTEAFKTSFHGLIGGMILFLGHIFSYIGHYQLYKRRFPRFSKNGVYTSNYPFCPAHEIVSLVVTGIIFILYCFGVCCGCI